MKKIASLLVFAIMAYFLGCSSGPTSVNSGVCQNLAGAKVIGDAYRAAPDIFRKIPHSLRIGSTEIIIKKIINDTKTDSVIKSAEIFYDDIFVSKDTCISNWFGVFVSFAKIGDKEIVEVLSGMEPYYGCVNKATIIVNGKIIDIFPKQLDYQPFNYESLYENPKPPFEPLTCCGFNIRQTGKKIVVFPVSMGVLRSQNGFWHYWFACDLETGIISDHGPDGT